MSEHTPEPWTTECNVPGETPVRITTTHVLASTICWAASPEDAEFIVRACNSHEDLLEACKEAIRQSDESLAEDGGFRLPEAQRIYDMVTAAVAKAEGK